MTIGVLHEPSPETRVSLLPEHVEDLCRKGMKVLVQFEAGQRSFATDDNYKQAGARLATKHEVLTQSDIVLSMHLHYEAEWKNRVFIGQYQPVYFPETMQALAANNCTIFSLDMLPQTEKSQPMDVLSSQANIAGYKAVLLAAQMLPRCFPAIMTAASNLPPAKVVIIGAGVAGMQAMTTAVNLGALVVVCDTSSASKDEVQRLGGRFIEAAGYSPGLHAAGSAEVHVGESIIRHQDEFAAAIVKADVVICTAENFGSKAPVMVTKEMIRHMKPGSVIIDLAAGTGGNTEITENSNTVAFHYVTVVGDSHLHTTAPAVASKLYGDNVLNFLTLITNDAAELAIDWDDDLVKNTSVAHGGEVTLNL